ncbi:hypothetical protein [Flavobacterium alvei]|uniref:hypothetical protein n=1 Tax=Flavobacterium alvei TaxID=2080416 RepID=UPI0026EAF675|nr:hypothetical protein [Flavobacterium alvei]
MKKYKKILLVIIASLFTNVISFAQTPGDIGDPADTNPLDTPAAPIDSYVWVLAVIGLIYVFLRLRAFAKQCNNGL